MSKVFTIDKGTEDGLKELLRFLLDSGKVKGVLSLRRNSKDDSVSYSVITRSADIESAVPLFPLMPINLAKQLSLLTLSEAATEPIAVVFKPCELRGFVELVKRTQANPDNILFISSICPGVYPLNTAVEGDIEQYLPKYWKAAGQGDVPDVRPACEACEYFVPYTADITVSVLGNKGMDKETTLFLNTEKAEAIVDGMSGKLGEGQMDAAIIERVRSSRKTEKEKLSNEVELKNLGIDELTKTFSRCIGCRNCSKACPACYCHMCFFETGTAEHDTLYYEKELEKTGCVNMLSDTTFYHLVRLFHVGASCTGCGQCADVCPANIPLWAISLKVGGAVQKALDYVPGKSLEEGLPITTFAPEEFAGVA